MENFKWMVSVVKVDFLRNGIVRSLRFKTCFMLQFFMPKFTFADVLYNLRIEWNHLWLKYNRVTATMVAETLSGSSVYGISYMKQLQQTTTRLLMLVTEAINHVFNTRNPALCLHNDYLNKYYANSGVDIVTVVECFPFAKFLSTSSLKAAINSTTAKDKHGEAAQINTIFRCRYHCRVNNF